MLSVITLPLLVLIDKVLEIEIGQDTIKDGDLKIVQLSWKLGSLLSVCSDDRVSHSLKAEIGGC